MGPFGLLISKVGTQAIFLEAWDQIGDMAVRMRKVLARPWVGVRVCHLLLLFFFQ